LRFEADRVLFGSARSSTLPNALTSMLDHDPPSGATAIYRHFLTTPSKSCGSIRSLFADLPNRIAGSCPVAIKRRICLGQTASLSAAWAMVSSTIAQSLTPILRYACCADVFHAGHFFAGDLASIITGHWALDNVYRSPEKTVCDD